MFQSLVITLREGVEAALIMGIVLGYLRKVGRRAWNRIVYWALTAAVVGSLVVAAILHRLQMREFSDASEGWLMLVGAAFVASMVVWMWRTGQHLKQEIETKVSGYSASPSRFGALGLFLFVFLMVFREGAETVLFLAAVSLRTNDLLNFIGGVIGLSLAIGLGVAFFKGSLKVNLRKFFSVTTLVLLVVALQLAVAGVHELSEARVLPSGPREMAIVGPIVNNEAFFFVVIVALCLFLIVAQRFQASGAPKEQEQALAALSGPERRKAMAEINRQRFWKTAAMAVGLLIIVLISGEFIYSEVAQAVSPPERLTIANGEVRIPVSTLGTMKLNRYVIHAGGADVRVLAILDESDTVRVGLDACLICGTKGYYQDGSNVICRNCAAAMNIPTIGMPGGCNPIHIDYRVDNGTLIISEKALEGAAAVFH
ncbi:MAG TPA: Fe-S-containing protein [Terriglobia bacterium]|nr:Fe-S-containing protein [Terriglobia bacterium]